MNAAEDDAVVRAYTLKETDFAWRGQKMRLALSHGIFSSRDIDPGTRLLLKAVSLLLDSTAAEGKPLPSHILDAGCGCGVIGIALARALMDTFGAAEKASEVPVAIRARVRVRAQDRDELARAFTQVNAHQNGLDDQTLVAFAEPLLAGPPDARYDLILSNLPAKAGLSVLKDFILRSPAMLASGGQVAIVIVNTLAAEVRGWIGETGFLLQAAEKGEGHTVFIFGYPADLPETPAAGFPASSSASAHAYFRGKAKYETAGVRYELESLHGVSDFDQAGTDSVLASLLFDRLLERGVFRLGADTSQNGSVPEQAQEPVRILVHEGAHGHFPVRLVAARRAQVSGPGPFVSGNATIPWSFVLSGRNVLALDIQARNVRAAAVGDRVEACVPVADLELAAPRLLGCFGTLDAIVAFPEIVPRVEWTGGLWNAGRTLLGPGGILVVSVKSTEAERFDRCRPAGFAREGEIRRDGFRALAYRQVPV